MDRFCFLKEHKFSHNIEMNIKTISDERNMSYKYCIENPMHIVERRLNMINSKQPHLTSALDRGVSHPLIGKNSHIPIIKQ